MQVQIKRASDNKILVVLKTDIIGNSENFQILQMTQEGAIEIGAKDLFYLQQGPISMTKLITTVKATAARLFTELKIDKITDAGIVTILTTTGNTTTTTTTGA